LGLFRQIKDLQAESAPVIGSARVLAVTSPPVEGGSGMEVALLITAPGHDPYEIVTLLRVPSGHVADVVPGAWFPVWIEDTDPGGVVVAWDD
jgi:hypothetical protein